MSDDNMFWPVGANDDDETQGLDGADFSVTGSVSLGDPNLYSTAGQTISVNPSLGSYGSYTSTQYVEQSVNENGEPTVLIHGDLVVGDTGGANEINVGEFMKTLQDRMLVLQPDFEAHEHYPALKDAYDQYKMLEKLLTESKNAKKD